MSKKAQVAPVVKRPTNARRNRSVVKFPKELKVQLAFIETKEGRDSFKSAMIDAIQSAARPAPSAKRDAAQPDARKVA